MEGTADRVSTRSVSDLGNKAAEAEALRPSIVADLQAKLGGRVATTVQDAILITAAVIHDWAAEEKFSLLDGPLNAATALLIARRLVTALALREIAGQHAGDFEEAVQQSDFGNEGDPLPFLEQLVRSQGSPDATQTALHTWLIFFRDQHLVDMSTLIGEAASRKGALITAASGSIFIKDGGLTRDHVSAIAGFGKLVEYFSKPAQPGIYIVVLDLDIFDAHSESLTEKLFHAGQLLLALQSISLLGVSSETRDKDVPARASKENINRWRAFARRCCLVVRLPAFITPDGNMGTDGLDAFVRERIDASFAELPQGDLSCGFESSHVLPPTMPEGIDKAYSLSGNRFHVNIRVDHDQFERGEGAYRPTYYVVPRQDVEDFDAAKPTPAAQAARFSTPLRKSGKSPHRKQPQRRYITSTIASLIESHPPKEERIQFAHLAIYQAARGRLGLCHTKAELDLCLKSAANLRTCKFEVLPADIALALLPVPSLLVERAVGSRLLKPTY